MSDTEVKTQIRGPWPYPKGPSRIKGRVPLQLLEITDDEPPSAATVKRDGHYDPIFRKLRSGQRLVCPSHNAGNIADALRQWLARNGIPARVQLCRRYPKDGMGGVWWFHEMEDAA